MSSTSAKRYFAASGTKEVGDKLWGRYDLCLKDQNDNRWQYANAYEHYYGVDAGQGITSGITRTGEQGELAAVRINRARALARALHSLVTAAKVSWRPQARNGDAGAAKATTLAGNLLEDFWKKKRLDRVYSKWVSEGIIFSQSFVFPEWDRGAGPPLAAFDDRLIMQGDITLHNVPPWRVHTDSSRASWQEEDWFFCRLYKSKWNLAKLHTKLAGGRENEAAEDLILGVNPDDRIKSLMTNAEGTDSDVVPVVYFFHRPTPALPAGRMVVMLSPSVVLADGPLTRTYGEVPLYRFSMEDVVDSPGAFTQFWDTLGPQELQDAIETTLATIITTLGNVTVALEKGSEDKPDVLAMGFRTWEFPRGGKEPKPLQLAVFPPEALKYKEMIKGDQQQIMGLNDVSLGQPQSAQMNAQAFAVLASMAVQQASPIQSEAVGALGKLGAGILQILAKNVSGERVVEVTGKQNKHLVSETRWTGRDLAPVKDVLVDIGNPMEQTAQGRLAMLQIFQQAGLATTPEEIQQVMETGRIEPATRAIRDELQLIRTEYEMLQNAEAPPVHTHQNHVLHYRENAAVLLNLEAASDPSVVEAVHVHLDEHYLEYWGMEAAGDPMRLERQRFMLGHGPMPMAPMDPALGGAPGAPPGGPEAPMEPPPGVVGPEPLAAAPEPPTNPATGAPFNPTDGGGVVPLQ